MDIQVILGDITKSRVDVIVNAANEGLRGGGGVDGAIHRAGGPRIMAECREIGHCDTGDAVMTNAGDLPAKKVIHAVGPVWKGGHGGEKALLSSCYKRALQLAIDGGLRSIAFPNISTGVYGYPKKEAAEVAVSSVREVLRSHATGALQVFFVCYDEENYALYKSMLGQEDGG